MYLHEEGQRPSVAVIIYVYVYLTHLKHLTLHYINVSFTAASKVTSLSTYIYVHMNIYDLYKEGHRPIFDIFEHLKHYTLHYTNVSPTVTDTVISVLYQIFICFFLLLFIDAYMYENFHILLDIHVFLILLFIDAYTCTYI
jgi:hypothetical protein